MDIRLAYGKEGLNLHVEENWNVRVVEPRYVPGVPDGATALRQALRQPLGATSLLEQVQPGDRVGIIFNDITRPTPNQAILEALLEELAFLPQQQITLFNALGTHRPNTESELRALVGDALFEGYRIVQNNAFEPSTQVCLGKTSGGHAAWVNRELAECDFKILTGFIEPHFFAGFSGGGKAVMPGMAGLKTILGNHDAANIGHPRAVWGVTDGNPIWDEVMEVAQMVGRSFLMNVTLNKDKAITGVFTGDLHTAHAAGCEFARQSVMVEVERPFDIVVTTNSGYPLDQNLYQSVKGMSAAAQVVRPGGAILIASQCSDGIPDHGLYGQLLRAAHSPQDILETVSQPGYQKLDQWEAQVQALVQLKAQVYIHSDTLSDEQVHQCLLQSAPSLEGTLRDLLRQYGPQASICVMPEGPQTVAYIRA